VRADRQSLTLRVSREGVGRERPAKRRRIRPCCWWIANRELLQFLERAMTEGGWEVLLAGTAAEARRVVAKRKAHAVLADAALSDERGVSLAVQLCRANPELAAVVDDVRDRLRTEENEERVLNGIPLLNKPFLPRDAISLMRAEAFRTRSLPASMIHRRPHSNIQVRGGAVW